MENKGQDMLRRRLDLIRASKYVKKEPVEQNEVRHERRHEESSNQIYSRRDSVPKNDVLREQFLKKNLSASDVIQNLNESVQNTPRFDDKQLDGSFHRAQSVMERLENPQNYQQQFYAHVRSNVNESHIPYDNGLSPLFQSNTNSIYNFQATRDNAKEVLAENSPFREVPYKVRSRAEIIGADLKLIRDAVREKPKIRQKLDEPSTSTDNRFNNGGPPSSNAEQIPQKEVADKSSQTTQNTGTLSFEITSAELEDLSYEKKRILLEFMEAFNIRDNASVNSIKERLQHRVANNVSRNRQQSSVSSYSYGPPI